MPFSTFRHLFAETRRLKLIQAFDKINHKFACNKWLFTCCRNYDSVKTIYYNMLDVVINTHCFIKNLLTDDDIDDKPTCHQHAPSMHGLDYLVKDFQYLLDVIFESVETRAIYEHAKFNVLFELAHSLNNLLESFCSRYISKTFNEK